MEDDHEDMKFIISSAKPDLCRLCHGSDNVSVHIGQHADNFSTIADKIHYCTSIEVKVDDHSYQSICTTCSKTLDIMYKFKSKAVACDLEFKSKSSHRDVDFTYVQVSDDPLNITYKLNLEDNNLENDSSSELGDSCVFSIVDSDTLKIEPVNISMEKNKKTTAKNDINESSVTESIYNENVESNIIENVNDCPDFNSNSNKKNVVDLKRSKENSPLNNEKSKSKKIKTENQIENDKPSIIVKNGKVIYICGTCGFEAESTVCLQSHRNRAHCDMGSFKCSECPTAYKTPGLLRRHNLLHHDVTHICEYCNKRFTNQQGLERHINYHHNVTPLEFQCVKCNAYFDTMDKMEDHLVVHYTSQSNSFSCNQCERVFTTFAAKNKHVDLEHVVKMECSICHVVLPTKEALDKHNSNVHKPKTNGNKMYACNTCGKYFSGIKDILKHRETHVSNKA